MSLIPAHSYGVLDKPLEDLHAEASLGFGENSVVGDVFIQVIAQDLAVGQIHLDLSY